MGIWDYIYWGLGIADWAQSLIYVYNKYIYFLIII